MHIEHSQIYYHLSADSLLAKCVQLAVEIRSSLQLFTNFSIKGLYKLDWEDDLPNFKSVGRIHCLLIDDIRIS